MSASLVLCFALLAGGAAAPPESNERLSLEELLARYRVERDSLLGELRDRVDSAIRELDARTENFGSEASLAKLMKLGGPSAPLLVPALDPGPGSDDAKRARAKLVADVLREFGSPAITDNLLALLKTGTSEGRRNALRVLGSTPDPGRVGPEVRAYFEKAEGEARRPALEALAEIGGAENERFLGELLGSDDHQIAGFALAAMAEVANPSVAPSVLALVRRNAEAAQLVPEIVAYYRACPDVVDGDHCQALLALVKSKRPDTKSCVRLLELLPRFQRQWPSSLKKDLRSLADASERDVAEAALVALTLSGDRGAKRDLLGPYDQRCDEQKNFAKVFEERGDVLYRIENYKDAVKDYREALRLQRENGSRGTPGSLNVQIARCYARMDKLKDAHDWLERAPISIAERRALATDPAFAPLLESPRYRDVFRLE